MRSQLQNRAWWLAVWASVLLTGSSLPGDSPRIIHPSAADCECASATPGDQEKPFLANSISEIPLLHFGQISFREWFHQQLPFRHTHPDDPLRHIGVGKPLVGTSWRNRPLHMSWMIGAMIGEDLIDGEVAQGNRAMGGYRLGWDFDHYWGTEFRVALSDQEAIDLTAPETSSTAQEVFWDVSLMYYPWGDARWRPYAQAGLGLASFRFTDARQNRYNEILFEMPLGVGLKYQSTPWLAWRLDATDNLAFAAAGLDTMHNVSLSAGIEVHFGGRRASYFPWYPGGQIW